MAGAVIPPSVSRGSGFLIDLQADAGLDPSRINRGDTNPIEAAMASIDDFSQFKVVPL